MVKRHKSIEGLGLEDARQAVKPVAESPDAEPDHDEISKILKVAIGGVAAGALLTGIYELARHRLNKTEEK